MPGWHARLCSLRGLTLQILGKGDLEELRNEAQRALQQVIEGPT